MTAYAASIFAGATSTTLNISPSSTFQARIARVEFCASSSAIITGGGTTSVSYGVWMYPSATLSSGSTVTPVRMRAGSPTAAATVKSGGTVTGTAFQLHQETNTASNNDFANSQNVTAQLNSNYVPAFDLIVANGSIFQVAAFSSISVSLNVVIYFEELRLDWST